MIFVTLRWLPARTLRRNPLWGSSRCFSIRVFRCYLNNWPWFSCGGSCGSWWCCWCRADGGGSRRAPPMREHSGPDTGSTESRGTRSHTRTPTALSPPSSWSPDICPMMVSSMVVVMVIFASGFCLHADKHRPVVTHTRITQGIDK